MIRVGDVLPEGSRLLRKVIQPGTGKQFPLILDRKMRERGGKGLYGIDKSKIQRPLSI